MSKVIHMSNYKRIQVGFTKSQWDLIENFRGELGDKDSDIVKNIIMAWLTEKSFITTTVKNKINSNTHPAPKEELP